MSNINTYRADVRSLRRKKKIKKKIKNFIFLAFLTSIAAAAFFTKDYWTSYLDGIIAKTQETIVFSGDLAEGNFPVDLGEKNVRELQSVEENVFFIADTHLYIYNTDGTLDSAVQFPYNNIVLRTNEKRSVLYSLGGKNVMVLNGTKKAFELQAEDTICYASVSRRGTAAVVTQNDRYVSYLTIYDRSGNDIFYWSNGARITDVSFTHDSSQCFVTTVSAVGGSLVSTVSGVDISSSTETFKCTGIDTVVLQTQHFDDGSILCIGDDKLVWLDYERNIAGSYEYPGELIDYSCDSSMAALAFESPENKSSVFGIFTGAEDEKKRVIELEERIKSVKIVNSSACVLTDKSLMSYNDRCTVQKTAPVSSEYIDFSIINDEACLLGYRQIDKIDF